MRSTTASFDTRIEMPIRPKIAAEIEWRELTPGADEDASLSASDSSAISIPEQLTNFNTKLTKYASVETGRWPLDGTMKILPAEIPESWQIGICGSDISDESGDFANPLIVTVEFPSAISSAGLTICFDTAFGEYSPEFIIRAYNGVTLNETINATAASSRYIYNTNLNSYDKLEIEVSTWSVAGQVARIAQIQFGLVWVKDNFSLTDTLSILRQISPVNEDNQSSELRFAFDDRDGNMNFMNPDGDSEYIDSRQEIFSRIGFADEQINTGLYHMSDWRSENGRFIGVALDALSLADVEFPDTSYTSATLATIAAAALAQAGITSYSLDASLSSITVTCDVSGMTCRGVLSAAATAACLTLYVDIDGVVTIGELSAVSSGYTISYANAKKPVGTLEQPLKKITVGYGTAGLEVTESYESTGREISVIGNPFITDSTMANAVLVWKEAYYLRRKNYRSDWRGNPAVEASDIVAVQNDFASPSAQVLSTQLTYEGGGLQGQIYSLGVS